jgi:glycosyltransferase involved in cell wall biosynthesis
MLISIITPSYNQAAYIEETIRSVLDQDDANVEYLIMDGGSTDGTLDILRQIHDPRFTWISEADRGQTDAINKGMRRAKGDILAWLNSDDAYLPGTLRTIAAHFTEHPDSHFAYGDAIAIDERGREYGIRTHVRQVNADLLINECDYIVQPASFWRASLWRAMGELDDSLRYSMDYDYWMRVAKRYPLDYLPIVFARERLYANAKTFKGAIPRLEEIAMVAKRHGGAGLPRAYAAEAAAAYTRRGMGELAHGQIASTRKDFRRAVKLRPSPIRFLKFFGTTMLLGSGGIPRVWLWLNQRRQGRKQGVYLPEQ